MKVSQQVPMRVKKLKSKEEKNDEDNLPEIDLLKMMPLTEYDKNCSDTKIITHTQKKRKLIVNS